MRMEMKNIIASTKYTNKQTCTNIEHLHTHFTTIQKGTTIQIRYKRFPSTVQALYTNTNTYTNVQTLLQNTVQRLYNTNTNTLQKYTHAKHVIFPTLYTHFTNETTQIQLWQTLCNGFTNTFQTRYTKENAKNTLHALCNHFTST